MLQKLISTYLRQIVKEIRVKTANFFQSKNVIKKVTQTSIHYFVLSKRNISNIYVQFSLLTNTSKEENKIQTVGSIYKSFNEDKIDICIFLTRNKIILFVYFSILKSTHVCTIKYNTF